MNQIIHVVRKTPPWSTCGPVTVCGNRAAEHDKTVGLMKEYIKHECRGSKKVAYGTCCVSCLDNMEPWGGGRNVSKESNVLVEYLTKFGRRSDEKAAGREASVVERIVMWFKNKLHIHSWYIMSLKEWRSLNHGGDHVCTKCGERRFWCDT